MKMKDLIAEDIDIDVYDDYDERCAMAVCGPVRLTEEGKAVFSKVLDMDLDIYDNRRYGYHAVVTCRTDHDAAALKSFLLAQAGYVNEGLYKKWFMEE